jgi:hypothetical protein
MARPRKDTATVNLRLRLPEALRAKLSAEADRAERSLNSEILWRLGQTFSEEWQRFIAGMEEIERNEQEIRDRALQDPKLQEAIRAAIAKAITPKSPPEPIKRRKLP